MNLFYKNNRSIKMFPGKWSSRMTSEDGRNETPFFSIAVLTVFFFVPTAVGIQLYDGLLQLRNATFREPKVNKTGDFAITMNY